jgi:hypothetical protein
MGTLTNAFKSALGTWYKGDFRFYFELAKGVTIAETFLPVVEYRTHGAWDSTVLSSPDGSYRSTDLDNEQIVLSLMRIRAAKKIVLWLQNTTDTQGAFEKMVTLSQMKATFLFSLGVSKYMDGSRSRLYVIRDAAASFIGGPVGGPGTSKSGAYNVALNLPSPELVHTAGAGWDLKPF